MQGIQQSTSVRLAMIATGLLGTDDAEARTRDALIQQARSRSDVYEALLRHYRDTQGPRIGADMLSQLSAQAHTLWAWLHNPVCLGCEAPVVDPAEARYVEVWRAREHGRVVHDGAACRDLAMTRARIRTYGGPPAWMRSDDTAFLAALRKDDEGDEAAIDDVPDDVPEETTPTLTGEAR